MGIHTHSANTQTPVGANPDLREAMQRKLAAQVERLIDVLDAIGWPEGQDADFEPDCDDEPSLGQMAALGPDCIDLELDTADDEPSLGWVTHGSGRTSCGQTFDIDLEEDEPGTGALS